MTKDKTRTSNNTQSGNVFAVLFGAVAMVGVLGVATYNMISGPITTMTRVNQKAMIDTQLMAASKIGVLDATNSFEDYGDCDIDGWVEPREWRDDGGAAGPDGVTGSNGGGYIPNALGVSKTDPYGTEYGYCVWNAGSAATVGAVSDCDNDNVFNPADTIAGDGTERRLAGDPADQGEPIMVIYSAGPNRVFESPCRNFVDTTPNDGEPDSPLFEKGGDDIIMSFTYAEASSSAGTGGLWQIKSGDPSLATIDQAVEFKMGVGGTGGTGGYTDVIDSCVGLSDLGRMRYNPIAGAIEACDGAGGWDPTGGSGSAEALIQDNAATCDGVTDTDPADGIPDDNGKIRYNSTSSIPQICQNGAWKEMLLGATTAALTISPNQKTDFILNADNSTPRHSDWQTFTIENHGDAASSALAISLSNTLNYETQNDTCSGNALDATGGTTTSCTVDVRFKSYIDGSFSGNLIVDVDNKPTASLSGNATGTCTAGTSIGGGIRIACYDTYDLIVLPGGCDTATSEPTCPGTIDTLTRQIATTSVDVNASSEGDGISNTAVMLANTGITWDAPQWCDDLVYNGYDDWYLPALNELITLYNAHSAGAVSGLASEYYWSSSRRSPLYTSQYTMDLTRTSWIHNWMTKPAYARVRCMRRDTGGGITAPPSTSSTTPGYIVITEGAWDGDLEGSSGLTTGFDAANNYCLNDLTNNNWMGRDNAVLTSGNVKAFLCEYAMDCQNFLPDTRYYFAHSGSPGLGGAYLDTDYKGRGPGNNNNWSGTNYLGTSAEYWTARDLGTDDEMYGSSLYWGIDDITISTSRNCDSWASTSTTGIVGNPNSTNDQRWEGSALDCSVPRHLLCMVNPSDATPTPPPPTPPSKPGFFVLSKGTWDGDLRTASGLTSPSAQDAADELCYQDLLNNSWKNREQAVIEPNNVEAVLNGHNGIPNATYYFAVSGDVTLGGAHFEVDDNGYGFGHNYPLYASNYFGKITQYWMTKGWNNDARYWGGEYWADDDDCTNWSVNTGQTGNYGRTDTTDRFRHGYAQDDNCSALKHLVCWVHPSEGVTASPLAAPLDNGPGYFVITKDTWDGDLVTAAANAGHGTLSNGWEAAQALCIDDLTSNTWDGRSGVTLNSTTVRPWLCGASSTNCEALPSQRYYFATSGYTHGGSMGYFDSTAGSLGPGDNNNWSGANYFNGAKEYWNGRNKLSSGNSLHNTTWDSGSYGNTGDRCSDYTSNTIGNDGLFGASNTTDAGRWYNSGGGDCSTARHLVCMVDPSTDPATAMPTPPQHTYSVPGAYTVTIDAGQSVTFKAWGAGGGGGGGSDEVADYHLGGNGGAGGYAEATVTPSVDTTYYIYVGGAGQPGSSAGTTGGAGGSSYASGAGGSGGDDGTSTAVQGSGGGGGGLTVIFADATDGTRIVAAGGGGGGAGSGDNCTAANGNASPLGSDASHSYGTNGADVDTGDGTGGGSGGGMFAATGGGGGYQNSRCGAGGGAGGESYSITSVELSGADQSPPNTAEAYYQTGAAIGGDGEDPSTTTPATQGGHGLVLIYYN